MTFPYPPLIGILQSTRNRQSGDRFSAWRIAWNSLHPSADSQPYGAWSLTTCHMYHMDIYIYIMIWYIYIYIYIIYIYMCIITYGSLYGITSKLWKLSMLTMLDAALWAAQDGLVCCCDLESNLCKLQQKGQSADESCLHVVSTKLELESLFCLTWQARIRSRTGIMCCDASPQSPFTSPFPFILLPCRTAFRLFLNCPSISTDLLHPFAGSQHAKIVPCRSSFHDVLGCRFVREAFVFCSIDSRFNLQ